MKMKEERRYTFTGAKDGEGFGGETAGRPKWGGAVALPSPSCGAAAKTEQREVGGGAVARGLLISLVAPLPKAPQGGLEAPLHAAPQASATSAAGSSVAVLRRRHAWRLRVHLWRLWQRRLQMCYS